MTLRHSLFALSLAALAPALSAKTPDGKPLVILIAGKPSHGPGQHEHNAGVQLLAKCLAQGASQVVTKVHLNAEWPSAEELAQADTVLIYSDGGGGHPVLAGDHLASLDKEMKRGCGFMTLHYAVEIPRGEGGNKFLDWQGGYFEADYSVNPHWTATFDHLPEHPITSGVHPFSTLDEWYYHMRFRQGMAGVTPILTDLPPLSTLSRRDDAHGGNPYVRYSVAAGEKQHVAWAAERPGGGRGFGFTGGHFHAGWANDDQRKLVLNAILWTATLPVPANGVESKVTPADLAANLDPKQPKPATPPPAPKPAAPAATPAPAPAPKPQASAEPAPKENVGISYGFAAAKETLAKFKVADGLTASLWAAEPMIQNPTNIDIDPRGRIWAVEAVNYRTTLKPWGTLREPGDRVVILEDTNGDGQADKETTFWQSKDLEAPLGVLVLPQDKGTQVIVSAAPNVWLLTDTDGDDKADDAKILFKVKGNWDHDHQIHAFTFGTDGKFYFNCGNESRDLLDADGNFFTDLSGHRTAGDGKPYRGGMVFRCDIVNGKPTNIETLGWNFRNNYEVVSDSFGTLWQSDNDDDGNKGVRINYVMPFGNYGYQDEMTGAGWRTDRTNIESEIPLRHWHQNDPGTIPNLLQTGGGSPTGITVYEGKALGPVFQNQLIHCDAGPHTVRAYPVTPDGAGYKATMVDLLTSEDPWYRPSDVAVAPDGSLFISDWYDAGVGGHNMADHVKDEIRGRIYRVAPTTGLAAAPTPDFSTPAGCVAALGSPNRATVYVAWQKLAKLGAEAESELAKVWGATEDGNPRLRARALSLLARIPNKGATYLRQALANANSDLRITAIRLCTNLSRTGQFDTQQLEDDAQLMRKLLHDPEPQVRREIALSLYGAKDAAKLWTILAQQHDGKDRWYLEALGIGATGHDEEYFESWLTAVNGNWNTPAGRDLIWRLRTPKVASYLARILEDTATENKLRYVRSFDFIPTSPEKTQALVELATAGKVGDEIVREALVRLKGTEAISNPAVVTAFESALSKARGTPQFVELVRDFGAKGQGPALLDTAIKFATEPVAADALKVFFTEPDWQEQLYAALATEKATPLLNLLGTSAGNRGVKYLLVVVTTPVSRPRYPGRPERPDLRAAAVGALARTQAGAETLIEQAKAGLFPEHLKLAAASALALVQYPNLKDAIAQYFPQPNALGGQPLPSIAELAKLSGDPAKGKAIFERAESSCITCHRVGDKGVDFGPALSEIGTKLPKETIFESIINPNAGVSMGFETWQFTLKDGSAALGLIRSETNDEVLVALPGGATNKLTKNQIAKREKLPNSMMPSGLNQALSKDDLVDLVAYLSSLKAAAK